MAPTTRRQQKQRQSTANEPVAAAATNCAKSDGKVSGKAKPKGHKRFDSEDEDEEEDITVGGGVALNEEKEAENEDSEEAEDEDDSDDDAPEAVTMGSGREAAKKREEDAKKAIEVQEKAARQKRKQRETLLKEQKKSAAKRRKVAPAKTVEAVPEPAVEEKEDEEKTPDNGDETPADQQLTTTSKNKGPTLLPASLLEKVADRPSPPPRTHKRAGDFGFDDEGDSEDGLDFDDFEGDGMMVDEELSSGKTERNRRKRAARKAKMEFKKGPVSVKVLQDDKKARKIMMPPANKRVVNTKSTWLSGRGTVKRRSIGSVGGAFAK